MSKHRDNPNIKLLARQLERKAIDRREFVRYAALLGLSATTAYSMAGKISGEPFAPAARAQAMPKGGTLRIGNRIKEIKSPHTYSWGGYDSNMSRQVVEYLTFTDEKGVTKPYLCESWEATEDLKTWTFKVRKGVKWRNGQDLTADHVIWNLNHVLDPTVGSSMIGLMKGYLLEEVDTGQKDEKANPKKTTKLWDASAIQKIDDFTVRFNCKVPQVAVPEHLFHYPMAILHPDDKGVFGVGAQGTGPFDLVEFDLGKKAEFKKPPGYWGSGQPEKPTGGEAYLDGVEMTDVGDDPAAAISALVSKQLHGLVFADPGQYDALKGQAHLQPYRIATGETAVMRMKCDEKPFNDARLRKAMRLAIDPDPVVQVAVRGLGIRGEHHHASPAHPDYAKLPEMKRDVAAAKKLLADAGFANGIEATLTVPNDNPWIAVQVENCVEQWKEAGINIKINLVPGAQYWDVWTNVPMGATIWYHRPLAVMLYGLAYRTGVPWNESSYSNAEFDKLLTQAEGMLDVEKRREVMAKLEKIMQDDGPIVQPLFRDAFTFMDKRVKGFSMHPTNYMFCNKLALEA
jgi:peptide/nickel transport system substrate-binding protein